MHIAVTPEMREAVRRINNPSRYGEYESATHDLAILVIAAIEEQEKRT